MAGKQQLPVALTIAGSDSGGGAGIQADLKTFAALGLHGVSAITCFTAQNPREVIGVQPATIQILRLQLQALFKELPPAAAKTGMLFSRPLIDVVCEWFCGKKRISLVVDPVMVSSSGTWLLKPAAQRALMRDLLPLATLVTPNKDETEVLLGRPVRSLEDLRRAARELHEKFGCATLVKGGHLRTERDAIDFFYNGRDEWMLEAPYARHVSTHGTGCTYSAAITAFLALGNRLPEAVQKAKQYISNAIHQSCLVGKHQVLNFFAENERFDTKQSRR